MLRMYENIQYYDLLQATPTKNLRLVFSVNLTYVKVMVFANVWYSSRSEKNLPLNIINTVLAAVFIDTVLYQKENCTDTHLNIHSMK